MTNRTTAIVTDAPPTIQQSPDHGELGTHPLHGLFELYARQRSRDEADALLEPICAERGVDFEFVRFNGYRLRMFWRQGVLRRNLLTAAARYHKWPSPENRAAMDRALVEISEFDDIAGRWGLERQVPYVLYRIAVQAEQEGVRPEVWRATVRRLTSAKRRTRLATTPTPTGAVRPRLRSRSCCRPAHHVRRCTRSSAGSDDPAPGEPPRPDRRRLRCVHLGVEHGRVLTAGAP